MASPTPPPPPPPPPPTDPASKYKVVNTTQEAEDAFDLSGNRAVEKPTSLLESVMHMVKGALGGGILSAHVAYMKAGFYFSLPINICLGIYMAYCLYLLVWSAQVIYKRTGITAMTYPQIGEAACTLFPNQRIQKLGRYYKVFIDITIMMDLFGSCACYQLIIANTVKQLVEDSQETDMNALRPGYPVLRIYMVIVLIPCLLIVLIRHLKYLAPFSTLANLFILLVICMTFYYFTVNNPRAENIKGFNDIPSCFNCIGMIVFSMSCAGVVVPIENNMKRPYDFPKALVIGMALIIFGTSATATFGYFAFLDKSKGPIIVNFPMTLFPKIVKGCVAFMILVTHGINFWAPFELAFHYLKPRHKPENLVKWEYIYRAIICLCVFAVAISFPAIDDLMGFIGCFCLTNMAFIWPILINLLVIWDRPGLGKRKWRLWRGVFLIVIGFIIWICGSIVSIQSLLEATFLK